MTNQEALKLIAEYDAACADCEKRPNSKAAGKRYMKVFARLVAAVMCAPMGQAVSIVEAMR